MEKELECQFLVKKLPEDIKNHKSVKLVDVYIPRKVGHAAVRIRQQGDKFFITKKTMMRSVYEAKEETIEITEEDFNIFKSMQKAELIEKIRYYYPTTQGMVEIDIFEGKHKGLALAEIEFKSMEELKSSKLPDFCLVEIKKEEFTAGGLLCKTSYQEIEPILNGFDYQKIEFD